MTTMAGVETIAARPSPHPLREDPVWMQALDWRLRVQAAPEDDGLRETRDRWLAEDTRHAEAYREVESVWRLTGGLPPLAAADLIDTPTPVPAPPRRRRRALALALAAAACLALTLLSPEILLRLRADYATGTGETRRIALSDGSAVELDGASAIRVSYAGGRRNVELIAGRAFFDVAPDPKRPFSVTADRISATALGTAFDVWRRDDTVSVAVSHGKVGVAAAPGAKTVSPPLLPGQRLTIGQDGRALSRSSLPPARIGLWRSGHLVVNGATVADVVEELRRHHRGLILLRGDGLAHHRVTGVFDLRDPEAVLRALAQPYRAKVIRLSPYLLVLSPA